MDAPCSQFMAQCEAGSRRRDLAAEKPDLGRELVRFRRYLAASLTVQERNWAKNVGRTATERKKCRETATDLSSCRMSPNIRRIGHRNGTHAMRACWRACI